MIEINHYRDEYYSDCVTLIENFYRDWLIKFDTDIQSDYVDKTIKHFSGNNQKNSFLLVIDGKAQGAIAGIEQSALINPKRIFTETFFYVNKPYGRYAFFLLNQVERMLAESGISMFVMAVMEGDKSDRIKKIYQTMGFRHLETHFIKEIGNGIRRESEPEIKKV